MADCLPEEMMEQIFLRLPCKVLFRFKTVSKSWCTLISSHQFVRKHPENGTRLKFMIEDQTTNTYSVDYHDTCSQADTFDLEDYDLYNSCDGLFLVHNVEEDTVHIWNPLTGQRKELPRPWTEKIHDYSIIYGFGYDSTAGVYKVLRFSDTSQVSLYTTSTNSWRNLDHIPYITSDYTMTLVNNGLHCLVYQTSDDSDDDDSMLVISFDLSNEDFREVPQPEYGDEEELYSLIESGSSLCLVSSDSNFTMFSVWMLEYGVEVSWAKRFCISEDLFFKPLHCLMPLYFSDNGELLLRVSLTTDRDYLVFYDSKSGKKKYFQNFHRLDLNRMLAYSESFISPYAAETISYEKGQVKRRKEERVIFMLRLDFACNF